MPDCKGNCNGGCNGGCSKPRKTCGNPNPCEEQECGCQIELSASCVRVREDYPCIGVNRNETIEQAIAKINEIYCEPIAGLDGEDGTDAYQLWLDLGNEGTEEDFIEYLRANCDCSPTTALYAEVPQISGASIGVWTDKTSLNSATPTVVTQTVYTVPTGQAGNYEVNLHAFAKSNRDDAAFYIGIHLNGTLITNGLSLASVDFAKNFYTNISLFKSNIALSAGDVLAIYVASSNGVSTERSIEQLNYKLTKLP